MSEGNPLRGRIMRLRQQGFSLSQIATECATTRSAVAGIVHRWGKRLPDKERLARQSEGGMSALKRKGKRK